MFDEIMMEYAQNYHREVVQEIQMAHMAKLVKQHRSVSQAPGASFFEQLLHRFGLAPRPLDKPVPSKAAI